MSGTFMGCRYFMGSVTNFSNAPFRRLVTDFGAESVIGEMAIAYYLSRRGKQDLALVRPQSYENVFGAQIVGSRLAELQKSAVIAQESGAKYIDFNCACPHATIIKRGAGAALLENLDRMAEFLTAIIKEVTIPVSIKLRKGYKAEDNVALEAALRAQDCGASAIFLHARTKEQLYRGKADWDCVREVHEKCEIPVIGCGDIAYGHEAVARISEGYCDGVAMARGALMKPWIFREIRENRTIDLSGEERLEIAKKLVAYSLEYFGDDERGRSNARKFLEKQLDFMCRYVPSDVLGRELPIQERSEAWEPRDEIEALWAERKVALLLDRADFPIA